MRRLRVLPSRYVLADGRQLSHIMGKVWELLTPLGEHIEIVYEVEVDYEPRKSYAEQVRLDGKVPR